MSVKCRNYTQIELIELIMSDITPTQKVREFAFDEMVLISSSSFQRNLSKEMIKVSRPISRCLVKRKSAMLKSHEFNTGASVNIMWIK
jgi:hypothetical protein